MTCSSSQTTECGKERSATASLQSEPAGVELAPMQLATRAEDGVREHTLSSSTHLLAHSINPAETRPLRDPSSGPPLLLRVVIRQIPPLHATPASIGRYSYLLCQRAVFVPPPSYFPLPLPVSLSSSRFSLCHYYPLLSIPTNLASGPYRTYPGRPRLRSLRHLYACLPWRLASRRANPGPRSSPSSTSTSTSISALLPLLLLLPRLLVLSSAPRMP